MNRYAYTLLAVMAIALSAHTGFAQTAAPAKKMLPAASSSSKHRGSGPGAVGGVAKSNGKISGSAIRLKR